MTKNITFKKICQYCNKPSDGPMLTMGETMAHAELFLEYLSHVRLKGAQAYRGRTQDDWDELERIYDMMKELNHRGT